MLLLCRQLFHPPRSSGIVRSRPPVVYSSPCVTSNSSAMSSSIPRVPINNLSLGDSETPDTASTDSLSPKPTSGLPKFWVVYNPEVKQRLVFHLAHVFIHEPSALCVEISPDGLRIATRLSGRRKTLISEVKTRSNVRSVWSASSSIKHRLILLQGACGSLR